MTFDEFKSATADLETFYEKKLNPTQVQMWFEEIKNYTVNRYLLAIKKLCKTSQYRPTLSAVLETIRTARETEQQKATVPCKACNGTGYILYHKLANGIDYEYASLCNCSNSQGKEYDGSTIADKDHRSKYFIPRAVDIFHVSNFTPAESAEQTRL